MSNRISSPTTPAENKKRRPSVQGVPIGCGLGCVDLDFECSTVCPILPRLMGIWQNWLGRRARLWNIQIEVNPTQVYDHLGRSVRMSALFSQSKQLNSVTIGHRDTSLFHG